MNAQLDNDLVLRLFCKQMAFSLEVENKNQCMECKQERIEQRQFADIKKDVISTFLNLRHLEQFLKRDSPSFPLAWIVFHFATHKMFYID